MKTIDEVIDLFDKGCIRPCVECPCYGMKECKEQLAAESYYLHKYQEIEDEYEELKDWWAEEHAENVPLSWDELKQMVGKPVWWAHGEVGEWLTIYCVPSLGNGNDNVIYATTCSGVECWIWRTDLDKFQYYRNEVKENMFHEDAG